MRLLFFIIGCTFVVISSFSQVSKRVEWDSANSCTTVWDSSRIVSKEIKTDLFYFKSNYQFGEKSFVEAKLNLAQFFDIINSFMDTSLRNQLEIEMPYHQFRVERRAGYSYMYKVKYKGVNHTIFRDCGCGTYKGLRITGGRFSGYNNQLFSRKIRFDLRSRNKYRNSNSYYRFFDFKIENGLPLEFVSYQDTSKVDKKIIFLNGKVDSIKSYYPNGELKYEASIIEGELNGFFIFYFENGDEKFKVFFSNNQILYFINELGRYDYNEDYEKWMLN